MKTVSVSKRYFLSVILLIITLSLTLSGTSALAEPQLKITQAPVFGQWWSYMHGTVTGVSEGDYWVAALLYVPGLGWYSKPYADDYGNYQRVIFINSGAWVTQMQTGGIDNLATIVAAYLIPKASYPACYPFTSGAQCVPESLIAASVASDRAMTTGQRKISWSGQDWYVKTSNSPIASGIVGPGSNYFSDSTDNVWVDGESRLRLKILYANNRWNCAEISSATRLGYGTYRFRVDSQLNNIDQYATLGLFTWSDFSPVAGNREIDLEFSTWGLSILPNNAQYVIQPFGVSGNMQRYVMPSITPTTHTFVWQPGSVSFESRVTGTGALINSWTYTGAGVPVSADERVHLNLWLNNTSGPSNGQPVEVAIHSFEFTPWVDPARPTMGINGEAANHSLTRIVADKYRFKLFGKVTAKDTKGLTLDDGSQTPLTVQDPGHTFKVGDFLSVEGVLSGSAPKLLDTSTGRIIPVQ